MNMWLNDFVGRVRFCLTTGSELCSILRVPMWDSYKHILKGNFSWHAERTSHTIPQTNGASR